MEKKAKMTNYKQREEKDKEDKYLLGQMGKLPPQAVEVEEVVLGALMLEREAINTVCMLLTPEMFYKDEHAEVYKVIVGMFHKGKPIDIMTVTNELRKNEKLDYVGGPLYVSELTNRVASAANIGVHSLIIKEKWLLRSLISISSETIREAYEEGTDVFELNSNHQARLLRLSNSMLGKETQSAKEVSAEAIVEVMAACDDGGKYPGISTGITSFDKKFGGYGNSDLVILGARPGMGKTSKILSDVYHIAVVDKIPLAVFSYEMSPTQLMKKLYAIHSGIDSNKILRGYLSEDEMMSVNNAARVLGNAPIYIDDNNCNIMQLRGALLRLILLYGIKIVFVDYLQLMPAADSKKTREQQISDISRGLKLLAKELNIPIVALSQLGRQVEQRGGAKMPILADLRESGAIEQDADVVIFLYRPEYYGFTETADGQPTEGLAEVIVAKNRHGSINSVWLNFDEKTSRFTDLQFQSIGAQKPTEQGDEPF